jgi:rhamnosyltransferase
MKVSIVIPTLNAEPYLVRLLELLKGQTVQGEIIVIDSSSSDNTVEIAKSFNAKTIIIKKEEFDHGGTRTLVGKEAEGDIIIYLTQDAYPANKYAVENLIKPFFEDEKIAGAYGRQLPNPDSSILSSHLRLFNYPPVSDIKTLDDSEKHGIMTAFLSNAFAAYKKSAMNEVGWFKEKLILSEDTYAGARLLIAGYKIAYVADAMVFHSHDYTMVQEFKRYFDIGVFHKGEEWIIHRSGRAEGKGNKYIGSGLKFLVGSKIYYLIPEFFLRNILKYIAYKLGKNYRRLPIWMIKNLSMNKDWWSNK